jgi:hypothetical protein
MQHITAMMHTQERHAAFTIHTDSTLITLLLQVIVHVFTLLDDNVVHNVLK